MPILFPLVGVMQAKNGTPAILVGKLPLGSPPNAYILTADSGTFTQSGQAANLKIDHKLTAATGSFIDTAGSANLKVAHVLSGAAGSFLLTGNASTLKVAHTLSGAAGTYALTGNAATLKTAHILSATTGSYTLSGQAATLKVSHVLAASQGTYAISGQAASLKAARNVSASPATFTLSGVSASPVVTHVLSAQTGAFNVTGQDATLSASTPGAKTLSADTGTFTLTGNDAALTLTSPAVGSSGGSHARYYNLSKRAATHYSLNAETGSFKLKGHAVEFVHDPAIATVVEQPIVEDVIVEVEKAAQPPLSKPVVVARDAEPIAAVQPTVVEPAVVEAVTPEVTPTAYVLTTEPVHFEIKGCDVSFTYTPIAPSIAAIPILELPGFPKGRVHRANKMKWRPQRVQRLRRV
jgi:hypothetical protein